MDLEKDVICKSYGIMEMCQGCRNAEPHKPHGKLNKKPCDIYSLCKDTLEVWAEDVEERR